MNIQWIGTKGNNFTKGRPGWNGFFIIILHTMDGYLSGCDSWFSDPAAQVSTHYGVGMNGEIHQYVSEDDYAWANGQDYANRNGISIEFEDNQNPQDNVRTYALYESGAQLIADICKRRNIACNTSGIKKHNEFVVKVCPGALDCERLISRANEILNPIANNNLYRIFLNDIPIGVFADIDNAFDVWYTNINQKIIYNNVDSTSQFQVMANTLQKQIDDLKAKLAQTERDIAKLQGTNSDLNSQLAASQNTVKSLQAQVNGFKPFLFGLYFKTK